jgi:hypothetical protein
MPSPLFDQLYVVGDSMSDSGGIYQLSSQALSLAAADGINTEGLQPIPVSPPCAGKFSNGPVLPEITAELLGTPLINFSFEALGTQMLEEAADHDRCRAQQEYQSFRPDGRPRGGDFGTSALGAFGAGEPDWAQRLSSTCRQLRPQQSAGLTKSGNDGAARSLPS